MPNHGEEQCDVIFWVGRDPDVQRIPAISRVLVGESAVFHAMLRGPMAARPGTIIPIQDVDGRSFDILLKYLYKEPVKIQSVSTALTTLYAAHKYMCPGLASIVVEYLSTHLHTNNVLLILQHICLYCQMGKDPPITSSPQSASSCHAPMCHAPSAPPQELVEALHSELEHSPLLPQPDTCTPIPTNFNCCEPLLKKCLDLIDEEAGQVLTSEDFEDLDISAIKMIVCRDSLCVKTENFVLDSLLRWSSRECKRQKLELSPEHRRKVLEGSQFLVRYLSMTTEDFKEGPLNSPLLTEEEQVSLLAALVRPGADLPDHLATWRHLMSSPRRGKMLPHGISLTGRRFTGGLRKKKRKERERIAAEQLNRSLGAVNRQQKDKFNLLEEIFICLACIFD